MNVNSVDNFLNWSGTRKTETKFSKASSFVSKMNATKKVMGQLTRMALRLLLRKSQDLVMMIINSLR